VTDRYGEPTPGHTRKTALFLGAVLLAAVATGFWFLPRRGDVWLAVWLAAGVALPVFFLVRWHARTTAYRCPACRHEFAISAWTDFITPHLPGKKYVACPSCGKKGWARVLMKLEGRGG
jgi:DNA-directed RNA polymerase subunit RPC12/RpoP